MNEKSIYKSGSAQAVFWVRAWLIVLGLMVYAMILIGGATRLTDSGLSITEWAPLSGVLPPLNADDWHLAFEKYKETAEFQQQNYNMLLSEFKFIYWWEWGHRLFGRLIGAVAVMGFFSFLYLRWLSPGWTLRFLGLIGLGGLQGFIGWWMVASGIGETSRVDVAPYRLMTHFGLALLILAVMTWFYLGFGRNRSGRPRTRSLHWVAAGLLCLIFVQMLSGALVAGLDAGRTYTDWPLMAGELFPVAYVQPDLGWRSLFEGRAATQFNHRSLAYLIWAFALLAAFIYRHSHYRLHVLALAGLVTLQAVWGIYTLLQTAPLDLALIHQGLGVLLLVTNVCLVWRCWPGQTTASEVTDR